MSRPKPHLEFVGEDLLKRTQLHRAIADLSHGLLGRSPDHVSSFVTGMAMNPLVFGTYADNPPGARRVA
jgi:4-hydroxyphenylacetate 3-monooxygenase